MTVLLTEHMINHMQGCVHELGSGFLMRNHPVSTIQMASVGEELLWVLGLSDGYMLYAPRYTDVAITHPHKHNKVQYCTL